MAESVYNKWSQCSEVEDRLKGGKCYFPSRSMGKDQGNHASSMYRGEHHPRKVKHKHPLCSRILESKIPKSMQKPTKLGEYDGKGDPDEYAKLVNDRINYYSVDDTSK